MSEREHEGPEERAEALFVDDDHGIEGVPSGVWALCRMATEHGLPFLYREAGYQLVRNELPWALDSWDFEHERAALDAVPVGDEELAELYGHWPSHIEKDARTILSEEPRARLRAHQMREVERLLWAYRADPTPGTGEAVLQWFDFWLPRVTELLPIPEARTQFLLGINDSDDFGGQIRKPHDVPAEPPAEQPSL